MCWKADMAMMGNVRADKFKVTSQFDAIHSQSKTHRNKAMNFDPCPTCGSTFHHRMSCFWWLPPTNFGELHHEQEQGTATARRPVLDTRKPTRHAQFAVAISAPWTVS